MNEIKNLKNRVGELFSKADIARLVDLEGDASDCTVSTYCYGEKLDGTYEAVLCRCGTGGKFGYRNKWLNEDRTLFRFDFEKPNETAIADMKNPHNSARLNSDVYIFIYAGARKFKLAGKFRWMETFENYKDCDGVIRSWGKFRKEVEN
ncbi:hypothetical protein AGMMS49941_10870 [Deferribacterales bacterium]|nr:hypothetical protein AGMMS49941_10870 [Deferribacterales bacterium]